MAGSSASSVFPPEPLGAQNALVLSAPSWSIASCLVWTAGEKMVRDMDTAVCFAKYCHIRLAAALYEEFLLYPAYRTIFP